MRGGRALAWCSDAAAHPTRPEDSVRAYATRLPHFLALRLPPHPTRQRPPPKRRRMVQGANRTNACTKTLLGGAGRARGVHGPPPHPAPRGSSTVSAGRGGGWRGRKKKRLAEMAFALFRNRSARLRALPLPRCTYLPTHRACSSAAPDLPPSLSAEAIY